MTTPSTPVWGTKVRQAPAAHDGACPARGQKGDNPRTACTCTRLCCASRRRPGAAARSACHRSAMASRATFVCTQKSLVPSAEEALGMRKHKHQSRWRSRSKTVQQPATAVVPTPARRCPGGHCLSGRPSSQPMITSFHPPPPPLPLPPGGPPSRSPPSHTRATWIWLVLAHHCLSVHRTEVVRPMAAAY